MRLVPGARLGPYEIVAPIGAGGMGEVYRAKDSRLGRVVAVKILPTHLTHDVEHRRRFEREAWTVASLNHPHICTLHDLGEHEGTVFLVMEHLEGQTLADRLEKGPLPLDQVLRYGSEIADALDKAHRQRVVHRDLKPSNVVLTKAGAKLLDFGLAKPLAGGTGAGGAGGSELSTQERPLTGQGTLLGTLQYMAPEQVEGKEVDARTDIFALGSLLYEMATGRRAFAGKSQASLIASILGAEPAPITALQPLTPGSLERLVKECLAKDPEDRWQSAHDVASELRGIAEGGALTSRDGHRARERRRREQLAWVAAALGLLSALALAVGPRRPTATGHRPLRFTVTPEASTFLGSGGLALSPDGASLVFEASGPDGRTRLWLRPLGALVSSPLSGTEGGAQPFWSPDGRFIAFFAEGRLKRVAAGGGPPQTIASDARAPRGGTWSANDVIVYNPDASGPLFRVAASGGAPAPATALDESRHDLTHRFPHFLPDGRHFVFTVVTPREDTSGTFLGALDSKEARRISDDVSLTAYSPPGFLLFVRDAALMAQPFDAQRLTSTGEPEILAQPAWTDFLSAWGRAWISAGEDAVAYRDGGPEKRRLTWLDREGRVTGKVGDDAAYADLALSPDGRRLALSLVGRHGPSALWLRDLERDSLSRLSADSSGNYRPVWSPTGDRIVFYSTRNGVDSLYLQAVNGSDSPELLLEAATASPLDWSPDGRALLIGMMGAGTGQDLLTLRVSGERRPETFLATPFNEDQACFSPDGRFVAYSSDETGRLEVYTRAYPTGRERFQASTTGGSFPVWRRDGRELYYLSARGEMMAVGVGPTPGGLAIGPPRRLFDTDLYRVSLWFANRQLYAVTADGNRFLVTAPVRDPAQNRIAVIVNWPVLLKR